MYLAKERELVIEGPLKSLQISQKCTFATLCPYNYEKSLVMFLSLLQTEMKYFFLNIFLGVLKHISSKYINSAKIFLKYYIGVGSKYKINVYHLGRLWFHFQNDCTLVIGSDMYGGGGGVHAQNAAKSNDLFC